MKRWGLLAVLCIAGLSAGCDDGTAGASAPADVTDGLTGRLRSYVFDLRDGGSRRLRFLEVGEPVTRRVRLGFRADPDLDPGDLVRVWGATHGDEMVVDRFEKLPPEDSASNSSLASVQGALTGVTPQTIRNAVVLVDLGRGVNLTTASAASTFFSPGTNFAANYTVNSYGGQIYTGDVLGPFQYSMTGCDWSGLTTALRPQVTGTYDHILWYMGSNVTACDWSGLGNEGNWAQPAKDAWFNAATDCGTLVQEVGHNNGWMHSSTLTCSGAPFADDPVAGCTTNEYGNLYSPMGLANCGHLVALDKWYAGYFGGCNGVKVTSSGTFNLLPIETPCNGVQGLQIAMPKTTRTFTAQQDSRATALRNYYLELRVNGTPGEISRVRAPTVLVVVGDNIAAKNRTSTHTFLLDMNPSTTNAFDGMTAAGQSFTDPGGGLTFSVVSIDSTHATVQVTYANASGAAPTCIDGTTLAGAGPLDCGSATGAGGSSGGGSGGAAGGSGGAPGAGGSAGRGAGGSTGAAGRGGGAAGSTGTAGTGGTTGAAGSTGTTGVAGMTGGAGKTGTTGSAGKTGSAGSPGAGGQGGGAAGAVNGGCACSSAPLDSSPPVVIWPVLGALVVALRRARAGRR